MRGIHASLTLLALGGVTQIGSGQDRPAVGVGNRVRLELVGTRPTNLTGQLLEVGRDSLTIGGRKAHDRTVLLRSDIRQINVSVRQESQVARGMSVGAAVGVAAGGVIALVIVAVTPACDELTNRGVFCRGGHGISAGKLLGAIGLAAAGGAEEGYRWALKHPRDIWTPARWPDELAPSRHSTKPTPVIGLSRIGDRSVLHIGLTWSVSARRRDAEPLGRADWNGDSNVADTPTKPEESRGGHGRRAPCADERRIMF